MPNPVKRAYKRKAGTKLSYYPLKKETMPTITKKQVKETAIRLWKNDRPETPIQLNSTEWELYMIKAEQIENVPTVIDKAGSSPLHAQLKAVVTNKATFDKVWQVISEYRSQFIQIAQVYEQVKDCIRYLPEGLGDDYSEGDPEAVWEENDNYDMEITPEGERIYSFLREYLCVDEIGVGELYDTE